MINRLKFLIGAALLATLSSCETDIKVNDEYSQTPVVYGVIDVSTPVHIFKINRTFLGEGNALDMAKVADSSLVTFTQRPIIQEILNKKVTRTFDLYDTIISGKPEGTFASGSAKYYAFTEKALNYDATYQLVFGINGQTITAVTPLVRQLVQKKPSVTANSLDPVSTNVSNEPVSYNTISMNIIPGARAKRIDSKVTFSYNEEYLDGSPSKIITIEVANTVLKNQVAGQSDEIAFTYDPKNIMDQIIAQVPGNDNIKQREILTFGLNYVSSAEDLSTYIDVNNPTSAVLQERPEYTNINNGIGIFSSTNTQGREYPVGDRTSRLMALQFGKKFCSKRAAFIPNDGVKCAD